MRGLRSIGLLFLALILLFAASGRISHAASDCDNTYLVLPPTPNSGTIYLDHKLTRDDDNDLVYSRKGYLPVGTILREDTDYSSELLRDYMGFVAASGDSGLVKRDHVRRIGPMLTRQGNVLACEDINWIVVPTSSLQKVRIFRSPDRKIVSRVPVFTFSRSHFRLVVITDNVGTVYFPHNNNRYYPVKYIENVGKEDFPRWKLNSGLILKDDRRDRRSLKPNGVYKLFNFDDENFYTPKHSRENCWENFIGCFLDFFDINRDLATLAPNKPPAGKPCGQEQRYIVRTTGKIAVETPIIKVGISAEAQQ